MTTDELAALNPGDTIRLFGPSGRTASVLRVDRYRPARRGGPAVMVPSPGGAAGDWYTAAQVFERVTS